MKELLAKLNAIMEDPYFYARQEKEKGRKIVGVSPMHFPEELVQASGALPLLLQEGSEAVTAGYGHIYPFFCGLTRSTVDLAIKGKLDFFDAMIFPDLCAQIRQMANIVRYNLPRTHIIYMQWPLEANADRWMEVTLRRLRRCLKRLEEILGTDIKDEDIVASIRLYNQNRELIRNIYQIRKSKPGVLKAREAVGLVMCSMVLPKEESNKLLEDFLIEIESRPTRQDGKPKVFLSGHLCQPVKGDILDMLDNLGMLVVGDDLYVGYRYVATDVPVDLPPLEALAHRYFNLAVPCPTRSEPNKHWGEYVVNKVKELGAQGVISLVMKHCEPHMIYMPHLRSKLEEAGIPHLVIETEHEMVSLAGVETRLEAFKETLDV